MAWPEFVRRLLGDGAREPGVRRPQIVGAQGFLQKDGRFRFLVTLRSARKISYDGLDILSPEGRVLGTRTLVAHDDDRKEHTHELKDIGLEPAIGYVFLRVRRRERGYDGQRFRVMLPVL